MINDSFCFCFYYLFSWYLKAQKIHPRNGRPYNQLAILAMYTVSTEYIVLYFSIIILFIWFFTNIMSM